MISEFTEAYDFLSNTYPCQLLIGERAYGSVEEGLGGRVGESRYGLMLHLVRQKFSHPWYRIALLCTGDEPLAADEEQGRLAAILMQVREECRPGGADGVRR